MTTQTIDRELLSFVLPPNALKWFDITHAEMDDKEIRITLTEKNNPPKTKNDTKLVFKSYKNITMSDFPIRGKRVAITARRRYWKIPGEKELITSDIPLVFPGTKLEAAFADFLKDRSGDRADILGEYSDFKPITGKGI